MRQELEELMLDHRSALCKSVKIILTFIPCSSVSLITKPVLRQFLLTTVNVLIIINGNI